MGAVKKQQKFFCNPSVSFADSSPYTGEPFRRCRAICGSAFCDGVPNSEGFSTILEY